MAGSSLQSNGERLPLHERAGDSGPGPVPQENLGPTEPAPEEVEEPKSIRHVVLDNFINPLFLPEISPLFAELLGGWESTYFNDCEFKKYSKRLYLPDWANEFLERMESLKHVFEGALDEPLYVDHDRWGGGLQAMAPGGYLNTHLDLAQHPKQPGLRRAFTLILFVNDTWKRDWGGELYLTDPLGNPTRVFDVTPGTLVAFENSDLSYHGVNKVMGPVPRVTLATSFLGKARPTDTRQRALFMPKRSK